VIVSFNIIEEVWANVIDFMIVSFNN